MKAIRIHQYGDLTKLHYENVEIPRINSDEILIKVRASGVNPVDWKIREGYFKDFMGHTLPLTLGWDVAGEVVQTGSDITEFQVQDAVFGHLNMRRQGAYAHYVVVKADEIIKKPDALTFNEAAGLSLAALTAWQALNDMAQLKPGQRVVIHAAAGGVGHIAVQLAKKIGAYVIGTASAKNRQFVLDLGVDEFIDYTSEVLAEQIKDVDVVLDTVGGATQNASWGLLKKDGILISIVDPSNIESAAKEHQVRGTFFIVTPNATQLQQICDLVTSDQLKLHVSGTFALSDAEKAGRLSQDGHVRGKLVLEIA